MKVFLDFQQSNYQINVTYTVLSSQIPVEGMISYYEQKNSHPYCPFLGPCYIILPSTFCCSSILFCSSSLRAPLCWSVGSSVEFLPRNCSLFVSIFHRVFFVLFGFSVHPSFFAPLCLFCSSFFFVLLCLFWSFVILCSVVPLVFILLSLFHCSCSVHPLFFVPLFLLCSSLILCAVVPALFIRSQSFLIESVKHRDDESGKTQHHDDCVQDPE